MWANPEVLKHELFLKPHPSVIQKKKFKQICSRLISCNNKKLVLFYALRCKSGFSAGACYTEDYFLDMNSSYRFDI